MKAFLFVLVFMLSFQAVLSADQVVNLDLKDVKIYISGAELTHSAKLKLKQGNNEFLLENIADRIKPNSINVFISGMADIMEISEKNEYLTSPGYSDEVKMLNDSLIMINYRMEDLNNQLLALNSQAEMLAENKTVSGMDKVMTVADLKQMTEYFYQANLNNNNERLRVSREIKKLQSDTANLQKQLQELNAVKNKPVHRIYLSINSKTDQTIHLNVKYITKDARWVPYYDIRVQDINTPVSIWHRASVYQNSGLDFNDVNLTLSTRNPLEFGDIPRIASQFLYIPNNSNACISVYAMRTNAADAYKIGSVGILNPNEIREAQTREVETDYTGSIPHFSTRNFAASLSVEYATELKYTIPSDNKAHLVDLKASEFTGTYEYYAAPSLRPEAFLVTKVNNWEDQKLLPGNANVYFENSFIGSTKIYPKTTLDTLTVSLGVDKDIIIEREILKDFTETKFLSSDVERYFAFKITIRNNRKARIKIDVEEIIPITKNDDINIELIEASGGSYDEDRGFLRWNIELEPGAKIEKILKYSVSYPSDKFIEGL